MVDVASSTAVELLSTLLLCCYTENGPALGDGVKLTHVDVAADAGATDPESTTCCES